MSVAGSQQQTLLRLLAQLRPHWRLDRNLPSRIQQVISAHRAFGSRDRRLYRELIYTTLRYLPWIEPELDRDFERATQLIAWLAAETPATTRFRAAFAGSWPACPRDIAGKQSLAEITTTEPLLPAWFEPHCPAAFHPSEIDAIHQRASIWLRTQTSDSRLILSEFDRAGWTWKQSEVLTGAIEFLSETDLTATEAYAQGLFEIQDLGSQFILESAGISSGECWLDACAGAGGKTLQLAALLGPKGKVAAHDIRTEALRELKIRADRADLRNVSIVSRPEPEAYDGVLVDAPCSGSGTWRRSPHLKWTTTPALIQATTDVQSTLLRQFSNHVRPGGRLLYATCSLSRFENEGVIERFLSEHPDFVPEAVKNSFGASNDRLGLTILPALHNTDGFFISSLRRKG